MHGDTFELTGNLILCVLQGQVPVYGVNITVLLLAAPALVKLHWV